MIEREQSPATVPGNPMATGQAPAALPGSAMATVESQRAIQEVQAAMVIAKQFPRDTVGAVDKILNACTRPTLATGALYCYPRGGTEVTGPSIRLAEAMAQLWGNMQFGIRELSQENGVSEVEAFAWDVETNTRQVKIFHVQHERHTRQGKKKLTDPRDVYELVANQGARRLRACILGVIPGDVIESAVKQCEVTQQANVEVTPDAIKAILEFFETYGVSKEMLEARLGKHIESINPAQMVQLRKIAASLKDGISKPSNWFDLGATDDAGAGPEKSDLDLSAPAEKKPPAKKKPAQKKKPAKAKEEETTPGELPVKTFADMAGVINNAEDDAQLDRAEALSEMFVGVEGNEGFADELRNLVGSRRKAIQG